MSKIEFLQINDNEYEIYYNNTQAGTLRFYETPDFKYANTQLTRFLGYININPEFRQKGILRQTIEKFNIKSLMVDNIDNINIPTLKHIYQKLGFKLIEGSDRFMIRN